MKGPKNRLLHRSEKLQGASRCQVTDEEARASRFYWESLNVEQKLAVMRFDNSQLVERVVQAQKELCRSDLQCYMLGIRGQDAVREKVRMNDFAITAEEGAQNMEFIAKAEFVERKDLFAYMESELKTPFLKGRPVIPRQRWHTLFDKVPSSWGEFLRQVFSLAELSILEAYQNSIQTSKNDTQEPMQTTSQTSGSASKLTDEQLVFMLEEAPTSSTLSKCAKKKARKKRQALLNGKDAETESITESVTEASSITMSDSLLDSLATTRCPLQSTTASAIADDDRVSVSTLDTTTASSRAADYAELQVDWSTAEPTNPAIPLTTVQEFVELQVDWNDNDPQPEETRWSAGMVDAFTGVRAEWHWVTTPSLMLTCGNLRAHVKNTFLSSISDSSELPEELRRAKSAPAPRIRKRSL